MVHYSAPTLCGIKPGNLFFVNASVFSKEIFAKWQIIFWERGLASVFAKTSEDRVMVLVYNVVWAEKILKEACVQSYLKAKGYYPCASAEDFEIQMFVRMKLCLDFPHEIGIILGYPLKDVIEFERHQGRDCKYCGYWKSYSDVENAKKCECSYKNCSYLCKKWFDEGYSVHQIVKEYKKAVNAA